MAPPPAVVIAGVSPSPVCPGGVTHGLVFLALHQAHNLLHLQSVKRVQSLGPCEDKGPGTGSRHLAFTWGTHKAG